MKFSSEMSNTIESMKDMRMSAVDHEAMIKERLFRGFADEIQNAYPDSIIEHQDVMRQTVNHRLTLHVETEKERNQRKIHIQALMDMNPIPDSLKRDIIYSIFGQGPNYISESAEASIVKNKEKIYI